MSFTLDAWTFDCGCWESASFSSLIIWLWMLTFGKMRRVFYLILDVHCRSIRSMELSSTSSLLDTRTFDCGCCENALISSWMFECECSPRVKCGDSPSNSCWMFVGGYSPSIKCGEHPWYILDVRLWIPTFHQTYRKDPWSRLGCSIMDSLLWSNVGKVPWSHIGCGIVDGYLWSNVGKVLWSHLGC